MQPASFHVRCFTQLYLGSISSQTRLRHLPPPPKKKKVEITESSCPIPDNVWVPLLFGALKWDRGVLGRPTVSMPALSRPGADVSRTQECTRGRVWRGQKATHLRRHSRDTKRNQWGQSGGEGGAKEKQLAMEESVKMTLKNY